MYFYEVLVADSSFKGAKPLTYHYFETLLPGTIVEAPVRSKRVMGVIGRQVGKPAFVTKPLGSTSGLKPLPKQLIDLAVWITAFYATDMGTTMQQLLPSKLYPPGSEALPSDNPQTDDTPPLTPEQQHAVRTLSTAGSYILHGETGSGKTRVYIELARQAFEHGTSSIVLTPEIGLTPQLARNFVLAFGPQQVVITHSKLTAKERNLAWLRMLQSDQPLVVIGPRSALFSPLAAVGAIILDESHESAYKQEQAPHYHAAAVAATLAGLHRAVLVLGSATPSVTDYYLAQSRQRPVIRLTGRAALAGQPAHDMPDGKAAIELVDLKDRGRFSRQPHLSDALIASIQASLQASEQSLVFLNRRGTARVILCQNCGWQALCPHCDLPLTYHGDTHTVRCHTCGYGRPAPNSCPECGSAEIILKSIGTKAVVDELRHVFPTASIQRFDTDNSKDERLEARYDAVRAGDVDIIVGTQLIAKGLDLPRLTTVGVVVADTSLYLPDYSAGERSYQLLRQVIGRVGRGHRTNARVIIQTYDPQSPIIQAAASGDWDGFYRAELDERRAFDFPPFVHTLKIWCRRATAKSAQSAAEKTVALLRASGLRLTIDGPVPAFYEKAGGKFQWQAVIKAKQRGQLIEAIKLLPANWSYDIDPVNLL